METLGILILAAGDSGRLGHPKQLLPLGATNLLNHSVSAALAVAPERTFLVLGANFNLILPELDKTNAIIVRNTDWAEGMAASIRMGMQSLLDLEPQVDAVILMVCDQPYISAHILQQLQSAARQSSKGIVASQYLHQPGTPTLFKRPHFSSLLNLHGDHGAKSLLHAHPDDLLQVPFELGQFDIDTQSDYDTFLLKGGNDDR